MENLPDYIYKLADTGLTIGILLYFLNKITKDIGNNVKLLTKIIIEDIKPSIAKIDEKSQHSINLGITTTKKIDDLDDRVENESRRTQDRIDNFYTKVSIDEK